MHSSKLQKNKQLKTHPPATKNGNSHTSPLPVNDLGSKANFGRRVIFVLFSTQPTLLERMEQPANQPEVDPVLDQEINSKPESPYTRKAFRKSLIALGLICFALIFGFIRIKYHWNNGLADFLTGGPGLAALIVALIGLVQSFKGIREPATGIKIAGLVINLFFTISFFATLAFVFADLVQTLSSIN